MANIEVFSGPRCSFCRQAKDLLRAKGLEFSELDVSEEPARSELAARLPRARSIPQIFIDGEHVGGYEDLCLWNEHGRLDTLNP